MQCFGSARAGRLVAWQALGSRTSGTQIRGGESDEERKRRWGGGWLCRGTGQLMSRAGADSGVLAVGQKKNEEREEPWPF